MFATHCDLVGVGRLPSMRKNVAWSVVDRDPLQMETHRNRFESLLFNYFYAFLKIIEMSGKNECVFNLTCIKKHEMTIKHTPKK
jgi:hypothetical protein